MRHADDVNVYVGSARAGHRVMESVPHFITRGLKLTVNEAKSAVGRMQERQFLGFSFTGGRRLKRSIAPKAVQRFRKRVRQLTRRSRGVSLTQMVEQLASYLRGWRGYFGFCETSNGTLGPGSWIRRRLRCVIWKQWKVYRRRRRGLMNRGLDQKLASMTAFRSQGPWRSSVSQRRCTGPFPVPTSTRSDFRDWIPGERSSSRTAVYGPVCTVVWEGRGREAPPGRSNKLDLYFFRKYAMTHACHVIAGDAEPTTATN